MKTQYIEKLTTPNLIKGQLALVECLKDVEVKNPNLYNFLIKDCGYVSDMQDVIMATSPKIIPTLDRCIQLGANFSYVYTKECVGKSGCYAFLGVDGKVLYIGSNTDYTTRMKNHYGKSSKLNRMFYNHIKKLGGFNHTYWTPVSIFDNIGLQYQQKGNTLTGYDLEVIKFVTQYRIRVVEQALINHYKPMYNSTKPVQFNTFWYYLEIENKDSVQVINAGGDVKYFSSLLKASIYTGLSDNHIREICNCTTPNYAYSSTLQDYVHFLVKFRPIVEPKSKVRFQSIKGFDLSTVPLYVVSVLNRDKVWIGHQYTYTHPTQAKEALNLDFNGDVAGIVNRDRQVFSFALNAYVYLVTQDKSLGYKHLEAQAKQVKVTNLVTGEVVVYPRQNEVHKALGMSNKTVAKYLNNSESYKGFKFEYL